MRPFLTALLLSGALLASCAPEPERPAAETPAPGDDPSVLRAVSDPGVPLPELLAAAGADERLSILDRLQTPERLDAEPFENRHVPGQVDTLRSYHYDGLRLTVYHVSGVDRALMQSVVVTSPRYETGLGFEVGATRERVHEALGTPVDDEPGALFYDLGEPEGVQDRLTVRLDGGFVSALEWDFYLD